MPCQYIKNAFKWKRPLGLIPNQQEIFIGPRRKYGCITSFKESPAHDPSNENGLVSTVNPQLLKTKIFVHVSK